MKDIAGRKATPEETLSLFQFLLSSLLFLIMFGACSTQGYSGPELSKQEISNIAIHSDTEVRLENEKIDGQSLAIFSSSMDVKPGEHTFSLHYRSENETCFSADYCDVKVGTGSCQGKVRTLAGRNYLISVKDFFGDGRVEVLPKGFYDFFSRDDEDNIGSGSCESYSNYSYSRRKKDK